MFSGGHAGLFGGDDQGLQHHGGRMPEIDAVRRDQRGAIERLHGGVIAERRLVSGFDHVASAASSDRGASPTSLSRSSAGSFRRAYRAS